MEDQCYVSKNEVIVADGITRDLIGVSNLSACSYKEILDKYPRQSGAVSACIHIENNILDYAYICDCGVIVYDGLGNIKFQTEDDKKLYSTPFINKTGIDWNLPKVIVIVRRDYRNNLNNIQNGQCVSYGALTGETSTVEFIKSGKIELEKDDIVLVYSDGFTNLLHDSEFIS